MFKKATQKRLVVRPRKRSKLSPKKRIKNISFKSSPWYEVAAQSIGVASSLR
jgi:hypothetical protein